MTWVAQRNDAAGITKDVGRIKSVTGAADVVHHEFIRMVVF